MKIITLKAFLVRKDYVYLPKNNIMVTLTNYTREEFLEIFRKAKARKAEWQKQAEKELNEMSDRIIKNRTCSKQVLE